MKKSKYLQENFKLKQEIKKLKNQIRAINEELSNEFSGFRKPSLKPKGKISCDLKLKKKPRSKSKAKKSQVKLNLTNFQKNWPESQPSKTSDFSDLSQRSSKKIMFLDSPKVHTMSSHDLKGNTTESFMSLDDSLTEPIRNPEIRPKTKTYPISILKPSKTAEVYPPRISPNESYFVEASSSPQKNSDLKKPSKNSPTKSKAFSSKFNTKNNIKSARK